MTDTAIKVDGLSKSYLVGHNIAHQNETFREMISRNVHDFMRKTKDMFTGMPIIQGDEVEEFWALQDVSFEIKQGDRVGIIGRNGAGKSTLLKVLSRITEPTKGRIEINGRVASLLEVGTGFHPELTGRENIFLNGAILGMSRKEIQKKFDEIVAFAEVEKFLDTPVKRYSSGMHVRLAFAVAAHLEPEILVVDEVLAVGDAQFQRKCLGKMEEVGKEGRTVLFVSHQMAAIQRLCSSAILLGDGELKYLGNTKDTIEQYLGYLQNEASANNVINLTRSGDGSALLTGFSIENEAGDSTQSVCSGDKVTLVFDYQVQSKNALNDLSLGFSIHNSIGDTLSVFYSGYAGFYFNPLPGKRRAKCVINKIPLSPGNYYIGFRMARKGVEVDWPKGFIGMLRVESGDFYKAGRLNFEGVGPLMLNGNWSSE